MTRPARIVALVAVIAADLIDGGRCMMRWRRVCRGGLS